MMAMDRRTFLRSTIVATAAYVTLGRRGWSILGEARAAVATPYGPLGDPDPVTGMRLPPGFTSRILARSGEQVVEGSPYPWHWYPDGGATFAVPDGWVYVSNSEVSGSGGAGALRFDADGTVVAAYPILTGTNRNCAGGATPWGTWLSCEEAAGGRVWECDPLGERRALPRHALGMFEHEAAVVDPETGYVYLTEDDPQGRFYRFRSDLPYPGPSEELLPLAHLARGTLEVAVVAGGHVSWRAVNPIAVAVGNGEYTTPTRAQVPESAAFARGEGAWFDQEARAVYFCTTGDNTVWAYDVDDARIDVLYARAGEPDSPLNGADNLTVSPGGEMFVCEDHGPGGGPLQMVLVARDEGTAAPFLEMAGTLHNGSELTGVAFDPSGTRMYLSSQRAENLGVTYEVTGPFRSA